MDCLFCNIIGRKIPANVIYETSDILGFYDIKPQAPIHILLVTKRHYSGVDELSAQTPGVADGLVSAANDLARQLKIVSSGYRLVINSGKDGGQAISHLHLHLLGGRVMHWPPG
jgi:histidine triad (HIT) family protein